MAADTVSSTHKELKERKPAKVVSHLEVHPNMTGGHNVHTVHTDRYSHPDIVKKFEGPHAAHNEPKGHILHHIGDQLGIAMANDVGAGEDKEQSAVESKESAEA